MHPWQFIALLGAVIFVYALILPRKSVPSRQTNMLMEIEETMEQFAVDIEEENKELLKLVTEMKRDSEGQILKLLGRIESIEKHIQDKASDSEKIIPRMETAAHPIPALQEPQAVEQRGPEVSPPGSLIPQIEEMDEEELDISHMNIKNRYLELIQLDKQGKSVEYIAKKLGMNKGEIQLILQLARQEEHFRV